MTYEEKQQIRAERKRTASYRYQYGLFHKKYLFWMRLPTTDDARRFVRIYEDLISAGDRDAIWRFYVFENNIIEEDASQLLDPRVIDEAQFAEAQSVSFFEARLFLRGTYETPVQLVGERLKRLAADAAAGRPAVRTWVAQGTGDEICPEVFAQQLVRDLASAGVPHTAYFFDAGHSAKSDGMSRMLRTCVDEFMAGGPMAFERGIE